MRHQLQSLVAAAAIFLASPSMSEAIDITFDLTLASSGSSISLTNSGYTLNLSNPMLYNFNVTTQGVLVNNATTDSFNISVSGGSLDFKSYEISASTGTTGSFYILDTGANYASTNNPLQTGSWTFASTPRITVSDLFSLYSQNLGGSDYAYFKTMTFSTVTVPEPSTYALGTIATGVMAFAARRRKARRA